jgi:predicted nucleic acid-binding protein
LIEVEKYQLRKNGKPALRADAMIAAIAMNNRLSVYTFYVKHFNIFESQGLMLFKERNLE